MDAEIRTAAPARAEWFGSAREVSDRLSSVGYLAGEHVCTVLRLADQLGKPILVEGPAGTGKTDLARSTAAMTGARLIRLQCYEGLDEGRALYEWNYSKQLLRILAGGLGNLRRPGSWPDLESGIFTDEFLLPRPLLEAIRAAEPVVLLIDEVDRLDVEAEALLLEVLSDHQVSIPELGTLTGAGIPMVFLTSNSTRDLSEALRRRCLYLHIDYPPAEREREIVLTRVPGISGHLAGQIAAAVASLRQLDIRERPSVAQTLEWARTLLALGAESLDPGLVAESLSILLRHQPDIELAVQASRKRRTACMHRTSDGVPK
jgi:MoxR-like ATPase